MYSVSDLDYSKPQGSSTIGNSRVEELKITHDGLIVKFIPDLKSQKDGSKPPLYKTSYLYKHNAGVSGSDADTRSHPSLKTIFGEDPEFNAFKELNKEVSDYVKSSGLKGKELKEDPTFQKLKTRADTFKPKVTAIMIAYERNSSTPKVVRLTVTLKDRLFGKPATDSAPAEAGLISEMINNDGVNPFDIHSPGGWIRLYKTGEGFTTEYFAEAFKTKQVVQGKKGDFLCEDPTPPAIQNLKKEDLPDLDAVHAQYHWTLEEAQAFVSSFLETGTAVVPTKALMKQYKPADSGTGTRAYANARTATTTTENTRIKVGEGSYETKTSSGVHKPVIVSKPSESYDELDDYIKD